MAALLCAPFIVALFAPATPPDVLPAAAPTAALPAEAQALFRQSMFQLVFIGLLLCPLPLVLVYSKNRQVVSRRKKQLKLPVAKTVLPPQLLTLHPDLSTYELKVCEWIISGLSSKQIASELNISPASVNTARYRIRRKLKLDKEQSLEKYLAKFSANSAAVYSLSIAAV